jgi:uncharacterized protein (TIGR02145 family)
MLWKQSETHRKRQLSGSLSPMRQNINYAVSNSWCYDNNNANCSTYGRLYNWSAALGACPPGWHLPSKEEFTLLTDYLVAGIPMTLFGYMISL